MVDMGDVKRRIADVLRSESNLLGLVGGSQIILGWPLGELVKLPCITITDVYGYREPLGFDQRLEVHRIILQVDVWADSEGLRDKISEFLHRAIFGALASLRFDGIIVGSPSITAVNDTKHRIFRHSIRYPVTYEVYMHARL